MRSAGGISHILLSWKLWKGVEEIKVQKGWKKGVTNRDAKEIIPRRTSTGILHYVGYLQLGAHIGDLKLLPRKLAQVGIK
jgi:hypothetical protein